MKKNILLITSLYLTIYINIAHSQSFVNGDLNGSPCMTCVPVGWSVIPWTDALCRANASIRASTDIVNGSGPVVGQGIMGSPQSGNSFVSGLDGSQSSFFGTQIFHEGLQQSVSGFIIGVQYELVFWQAVVKDLYARDSRGSWGVYINNIFLQQTATTYSGVTYNSTSFPWEERRITFTATANVLNFKFLVEDDDADAWAGFNNLNGALRMGIDNISITPNILFVEVANFGAKTIHHDIAVQWETLSESKNDYFTLEHSMDGFQFETLTHISGAGNSNEPIIYDYRHQCPPTGTNYYRLKQTDYNGQFSYTRIIALDYSNEIKIKVYPNPAIEYLIIETMEEIGDNWTVKLYDLQGQVHQVSVDKMKNRFSLNTSSLGQGVYTLMLEINGKTIHRTIQIE